MQGEEDVSNIISKLKELKIREDALISQLETAIRQDRPKKKNPTEAPFAVGDRVFINNRLTKPVNWDDTKVFDAARERHATVTSVTQTKNRLLRTEGRVHIITDNGTETWRAPKNLRLLAPRKQD
jgi:hypothetical protein